MSFDPRAIREDFPIFHQQINGRDLVYLDSAATAQVPRQVIDALVHFHTTERANVHRGIHTLSQRASQSYEDARSDVASYLNADTDEIIFTRGTTESLNLLANTLSVGPEDEIVVTEMEHHSNLVPWQMLCARTGASLRVVPVDEDGALMPVEIRENTRIVSVVHVSNTLGTINPISQICADAHEKGAVVVVDGAQAIPHAPVDVRALGADFYVFSGHKLFGPTGIGVLYGRKALLAELPPWEGGGGMIDEVFLDHSTWDVAPARFEAGTPNIAGAIGLGAAVRYCQALDWDAIAQHEKMLLDAATEVILGAGARIIGTASEKASVVSFVMEGPHPSDIGTILDNKGIAIRTGHHCTQPLMRRFGVPATARASFAIYNTLDDVERLAGGLRTVTKLFG